jgi:hypothetical protein
LAGINLVGRSPNSVVASYFSLSSALKLTSTTEYKVHSTAALAFRTLSQQLIPAIGLELIERIIIGQRTASD